MWGSGSTHASSAKIHSVLVRARLSEKISSALNDLLTAGELPSADYPAVEIIETRGPEHGDFSTNFAMASAKAAGMAPRAIAEKLAERLSKDEAIEKAEVAGPGFLNLFLRSDWTARQLDAVCASEGRSVLNDADHYAHRSVEQPEGINVEFVSVNPNGPITIGSGRGAAYGSTLCNVLQAAGTQVHREYYINDGVNSEQMRQFAASVQALAAGQPVPEKGYKGDYVQAVADTIKSSGVKEDSIAWFQEESQRLMLAKQHEDLEDFATTFDTWFSEQSLHDTNQVEADIQKLIDKGLADEEPHRTKITFGKGGEIKEVVREDQPQDEDDAAGTGKTLWLRSTKLGDDMDRVLRRKDGRLTYISSDISYHRDKLNRPEGADKMITILGPDHHGYIGRLQAVVAANIMQPTASAEGDLTEEESLIWDTPAEKAACQTALAQAKKTLEVQIFQLVRFLKDGKPAPMRKRDGNIYALIDLVNEIGEKVKPNGTVEEKQTAGKDVARFFYLMRHHDTTFDFDLDLAEKQSDENPVFYVQYAHARICSVIEKAATEGLKAGDTWKPELLQHPREKALMLKILDLPHEIERCAEDYGVNRLTTYAIELARTYHHFYDACRVILPEDVETSHARLALCSAARTALQSVLEILGVSAPQRMERSEAS